LRIERGIIALHRAVAVFAEKVPLSGAARYRGGANDIDVYPDGRDGAPLCGEVKARGSGAGFVTLERWLGNNDVLFLRRDRTASLVVLNWTTWVKLIRSG
jgi:hypothetical protein